MKRKMSVKRAKEIISKVGKHHEKSFITDKEYDEAVKILKLKKVL